MDHSEKIQRLTHPRENANIFSLCSFLYTGKIFKRGLSKELEDDDLYEVVNKFRSKKLGDEMEKAYFEDRSEKFTEEKKSIYSILWSMFGKRYIVLGLLSMSGRLFDSIVEPEALSRMVLYFTPGQTSMILRDVILYAFILIGSKTLHTFTMMNYSIFLHELGIQVKNALCSIIYRKTLRINPKGLEKTNLGNIVNVITKDVSRIKNSMSMVNEIWISLVETPIIFFILYRKIGFASVVGVAILLSLVPLQGYISKVIRNLRLKVAKKTDERLQRMQETLSAIKTIKMYTWEAVFAEKIEEARLKEMKTAIKTSFLRLALIFFSITVSEIGFCVMVLTYIWIHQNMSAADIFYAMKIFGTLRQTTAMNFSVGLTVVAEMTASLKRITHILRLEELPEEVQQATKSPTIELRGVNVNFKNEKILRNINLKLQNGLNIVTGHLGCGKSSLIKVILGDYVVDTGDVRISGRKSYASQDPWLFPSSIKQNILFGETYDFQRYQEVVSVCALEYDFNILEKGDETIVIDRGMNLSKGQQARINLARAVYKDSDIYLIDDSLTTLDPKVQEHIFNKCIKGFLQGKCIIFVTHNGKHIKQADKVIILKDGQIHYSGDQQNIQNTELEEITDVEILENNEKNVADIEDTESTKLLKDNTTFKRKQVYHENKKSGGIELKLYLQYVKFGGGYLFTILLCALFTISSLIVSSSQKMLSNWINQKASVTNLKQIYLQNTSVNLNNIHVENDIIFNLNETLNITFNDLIKIKNLESQSSTTLQLYAGLIIGFCCFELLKHYTVLRFGVNASLKIHKRMTTKVINAVMPFFDSFFIGNILNRFSQDLFTVDEELPFTLTSIIGVLFQLIATVGLMLTVNWKFVIPAAVLAVVSVLLNILYIRVARNLKRLEAATRSPIIGHLNSTMEGLTTIRAYKAQEILADEFDKHQDVYTSASFTFICVRVGSIFYMQLSSVVFVASVVFRLIFFEENVRPGDIGLTLTQAAMMTMLIHVGLICWSEAENNMTSVERAMEFTTVETEKTTGSEIKDWPQAGAITYENVSLKYNKSQKNVLKDINFTVEPRSRIGIVGRTGAGKSTLISILFRLYDYDGQIIIDGVELKTVSLKYLRKHISIIPQDPIMFSGTIRSNVDPLNEFSDQEIWQSLQKVELHSHVSSLDALVDSTNFSTGQRQLICLARAIIRKNKIVVLDEATANMDPETEQLAQQIIRENFLYCTLFIIAHRLESILDCDKILVMERGRIAEFDEPSILLKNENSLFSEMLRNSGASHN